MSVDHKFKQELHRLEKGSPPIAEVYMAVAYLTEGHERNGDAIRCLWAYFYPVALRNALEYFKDEEDARTTAFEFMEHWVGEPVKKYREDVAKITPFFKSCMKNFYHSAYEVIKRGPILVSENERGEGPQASTYNDDDGTEALDTYAHFEAKVQFGEVYSYPYTGAESDILDKILDNEKLTTLLDDLYPGEQEVLKLLVEGYSTEEIQEVTGRTPAAVNQSMARIRSAI